MITKFPQPKMFVEPAKVSACIRVQHTKNPSSERVTAHGVVPNCFFGFKDVVDHHRWMSLIGNLDLVVGAWAGIRDTRLGKLGRADRVCASLLLPGCHANGRQEMRVSVFG
jgi:hypothetical protein